MKTRTIPQRRRPLPWLIAAAWMAPMAALAQTADPVEHCRTTTDSDAARIACLEKAIARLMQDGGGAPRTAEAAEGGPAAGSVSVAAETAETDELQAATVHTAQARAAETGAAEVSGLGAEQVAARQRASAFDTGEQRERVTAAITDIRYTATGRPVFTLDNGQIWRGRQPDPKFQRFTMKRHKTVQIWDSPIGGYRLKVDKVKRVLQVERIR